MLHCTTSQVPTLFILMSVRRSDNNKGHTVLGDCVPQSYELTDECLMNYKVQE